MTVRPEDYGDQYPSDQGDTPPQSPVEGFQERDYRVRGHQSQGIPVRPPVKDTPDLRVRRERPEPRPIWAGVIVNKVADHKYTVLRQDGRRGVAYTRGDDDVYDHLTPGEQVALIAAMEPNQWLIVCAPRRKEMQSLRLSNLQPVTAGIVPKQIVFDEELNSTGLDQGQLMQESGGFKVKPGQSGQYEISLQAHVQYLGQSSTPNKLLVTAGCITSSGETALPTEPPSNSVGYTPDVLNFFPDSGFRVYQNEAECRATVVLQIGESNFMPYSPTGGGPVVWSDSPKVAKALEIGSHAPRGWLKIINNANGGIWLTHGDSFNLKFQFPNSSPSTYPLLTGPINYSGQHLYAWGHNADGVRMEWTKPGVTGIISIPYDGGVVNIEVDKGIVIKAPGCQNHGNGSINLTDSPERQFNKCPSF